MLEDIRKKKEEFKKNQMNNVPSLTPPPVKEPDNLKDLIGGVKQRIDQLYQRQNSA